MIKKATENMWKGLADSIKSGYFAGPSRHERYLQELEYIAERYG